MLFRLDGKSGFREIFLRRRAMPDYDDHLEPMNYSAAQHEAP
jgi:hypothetical protein